jgi:hypothetical protein
VDGQHLIPLLLVQFSVAKTLNFMWEPSSIWASWFQLFLFRVYPTGLVIRALSFMGNSVCNERIQPHERIFSMSTSKVYVWITWLTNTFEQSKGQGGQQLPGSNTNRC